MIGNKKGKILDKYLYPSSFEVDKFLKNKKIKLFCTTGHLKNILDSKFNYSEVKALITSINNLKEKEGTLIDVGGQDLKILNFEAGKIISSKINRRCASGTGSFLDFISHKLNLNKDELNKLAGKTKEFYPLNSYCTVFSSFEIIEMVSKRVKIEVIARSLFYSMALRIYELGPFKEPVFLSGGVAQHFPVFEEVLEEVLKIKIKKIKDPQFFQAKGALLLLLEDLK